MGVRGLHEFFKSTTEKYELKDTRLVIDAANLLHTLYFVSPATTEYGGDYNVFAKYIEIFCNRLKKAKVTPYFVFDGASELHDLKFDTLMKRAEERIKDVSKKRKEPRILPCLTYVVRIIRQLYCKHRISY